MGHGRLILALVVASLSLAAAGAGAATRGTLQQPPGAAGCVLVADDASEGCTLRTPFKSGGVGIVPSPDGRHVYYASSNVLYLFDRAADGTITNPPQPPSACYSQDPALGCTTVPTLLATGGVAISPDGRHVYVSSPVLGDQRGGFVTAFARDASTGRLTSVGCIAGNTTGTSCTRVRAIRNPYGLAFSPDGDTLYVADRGTDAVVVLSRDVDTGTLNQPAGTAGCVRDVATVDDGCADGAGLEGVRSVTVSPDGGTLLVLSPSTLAVFARRTLTAKGCFDTTSPPAAGCVASQATGGRATFAADSKTVYVADGSAVAVLRRQDDGSFAPADCCAPAGVPAPRDVALSPDGDVLYVASDGDVFGGIVAAYARRPDGALTRLPGKEGCFEGTNGSTAVRAGCTLVRGMTDADLVAAVGRRSLYVGGRRGLVSFRRLLVPRNDVPPVITGNRVVGGELFCSTGTWLDAISPYVYQWVRGDEPIAGADAATYTAVPRDGGETVRCVVTAGNGDGTSEAASAGVLVEEAPPEVIAPALVRVPGVSGDARDEATLISDVGLWEGTAPLTYARQWLRCDAAGDACAQIAGATGASYDVRPEDIGATLRVQVTASNAAGSASARSDAGSVVVPAPPRNVERPVVTGAAAPGETLRVTSTGVWRGTQPLSFAVAWKVCRRAGFFGEDFCATIATGPDYTVRERDRGGELHAEVTATNGAGSAVARTATVRVLPCELEGTPEENLCGRVPVVFIPGFGASALECDGPFGAVNLWPSALFSPLDFAAMTLKPDGTGLLPTGCGQSVRPNGDVLTDVAKAINIHGGSQAWLRRVAPGHAYVFGWDWRKSPAATVDRLDTFINGLRLRHGVPQVAVLNHSYGGLLTRWYIDEPRRAEKVARVANIASPWWGSPKAWFALARGFETPDFSAMDVLMPNILFKPFSQSIPGLYYLLPTRSWFEQAPAALRRWLEIDEVPLDFDATVTALEAFGAQRTHVLGAVAGHRDRLAGFKGAQRAGVDWRIFVGSGVPTLGHIRDSAAWAPEVAVSRISWVNGDGTVPLVSQRRFASDPAAQEGERVPTYYFCGIEHMDEPETPALQQALLPFLLHGGDPAVDGRTLRPEACKLEASQFSARMVVPVLNAGVLHGDVKAIGISAAAELQTTGPVRARAATASEPVLSLAGAEQAGLIDLLDTESRETVTFVSTTPRPLTVRIGRRATVSVTAVRRDGRTGAPVQYGPLKTGATVSLRGAGKPRALAGGRTVRPARRDVRAPRTSAQVRRRGSFVLLSPRVRDASRTASYLRVGRGEVRRWRGPVRVPRAKLRSVRISSVDAFGNAETPHRVR